MKLKNKLKELIAKFYYQLPDEMICSVLDNAPKINRKWNRQLADKKGLREKLMFALTADDVLIYVIDKIYEQQKEKISFSLDSADYQEMIDSYCAENYILNTVFLFKKCKDDIDFCNANLDNFIKSKLYHDIIFSTNPQEKLQTKSQEAVREIPQQKILISEKNNIKPEEKSMKLYGRIDIRNEYYNFAPQYIEKNAEIIELHTKELEEMYPSHGAFNLKGSWGSVNEFLKRLNAYEADSIEQNFYVMELKESDLQENNDDNYRKRIDLAEIIASGRRLQNVIRPIQDACFYRAVTPVLAIDNDSFSDSIEINEEECPEKEPVVLLFDGRLYGPFEVSKKYSDKKCIRPEAVLKNYLLSYCDANTCQNLEFDIQIYGQNPIPVSFYKFIPDHKKQDVIPDSVLLEKLKDNIHPELALENPDEFIRICSNSPFLGKLPEDVRKNRIARVKELITRVAMHRNDIASLTEELLNQIGHQIPENLIESSEIYQKQSEKLRILYESQEDLQANLENLTAELKNMRLLFRQPTGLLTKN